MLGSATSVVRSRLVGTEKFSVFVLQMMVFLDDSGGNKRNGSGSIGSGAQNQGPHRS